MLIEVLKQEYLGDNNLFLSRLVDELHKLGAPITFKGSMIIQYLTKNRPDRLLRRTIDTDCNWDINELSVTMQELTDYVKNAVANIDSDLVVEVSRNFDVVRNVSAGFTIHYRNSVIGKLDVSIRPDYFDDVYITYEGVKVRGAHLFKILVDKFSTVSTNKIFYRFKDLVDLYIIAYSSDEIFDTEDILLTASLINRDIGDFSQFRNDKSHLESIYAKFKRLSGNQPNFNVFYNRLYEFFKPFFNGKKSVPYLVWHECKWHLS